MYLERREAITAKSIDFENRTKITTGEMGLKKRHFSKYGRFSESS